MIACAKTNTILEVERRRDTPAFLSPRLNTALLQKIMQKYKFLHRLAFETSPMHALFKLNEPASLSHLN